MSRIGITRKRRMRHGILSRLSRSTTLTTWLAGRVAVLTGTGATRTVSSAANATDQLTSTSHGFVTGEGPLTLATLGTLPAGLSTSADYWAIRVDGDIFQLAPSQAAASRGIAVNFTDDGTGTFTAARSAKNNGNIREWIRNNRKPEQMHAAVDIDAV